MRNAIACWAILLTVAAAPGADEWREVLPASGDFRVAFPGDAKRGTQIIRTAVGDLRAQTHFLQTHDRNHLYFVCSCDLPTDTSAADMEASLTIGRNASVKAHGGQLTGDEPAKVLGHPGRRSSIRYELKGGAVQIECLQFFVERRLYQLSVTYVADHPIAAEDIAKFFNSFQLTTTGATPPSRP